jgi:Mn-dependent DtxR family transcriptional regulator
MSKAVIDSLDEEARSALRAIQAAATTLHRKVPTSEIQAEMGRLPATQLAVLEQHGLVRSDTGRRFYQLTRTGAAAAKHLPK